MSSLLARFRGDLLYPDDLEYDEARKVWNGMHDRYPACIARCRDVNDVSYAVRHAAKLRLPVTVRGGGHNVAGAAIADGAYLIDLSRMRDVVVDAKSKVAVASGGCLLRDVDQATAPHGLACPSGVVSHTGLGGLALGGGYGWLARRWGLTCDHITAAQVVLADGSIVETSAKQHPELFWALCGGGAGFGVVTRFTLQLRSVRPMYYQRVMVSSDFARDALKRYRRFAPSQPNDLHVVGSASLVAPHDELNVAPGGEPAFFFTALYTGNPLLGSAATAELFDSSTCRVVDERTITFLELQALADNSEPHGHRYFTKSTYLSDLSSRSIDGILASAAVQPSPMGSIDFEYLRGAIDRPEIRSSAFPRREAPYMCTFSAHWTDPAQDPIQIAWARTSLARMSTDAYGGAYLNYLHDEPEGVILQTNGTERQRRLDTVRTLYDPRGTFLSSADASTRKSPTTTGLPK